VSHPCAMYHAQPMANDNMSRGFSRAYNLALGHSLRQLWKPHAALFRGPGMVVSVVAGLHAVCSAVSQCFALCPVQMSARQRLMETLVCRSRGQGLGLGSRRTGNMDPGLRPGPDSAFFRWACQTLCLICGSV
jgi:hypothetical protein